VYIDIWATWCEPCLREIPYLKKLEKKHGDKNIEFISISVDKKQDHDTWKKMIKEKALGGVQLFADNDFKSKFIQDYSINTILKFILLYSEIKLINADTPKPSNDKFK